MLALDTLLSSPRLTPRDLGMKGLILSSWCSLSQTSGPSLVLLALCWVSLSLCGGGHSFRLWVPSLGSGLITRRCDGSSQKDGRSPKMHSGRSGLQWGASPCVLPTGSPPYGPLRRASCWNESAGYGSAWAGFRVGFLAPSACCAPCCCHTPCHRSKPSHREDPSAGHQHP